MTEIAGLDDLLDRLAGLDGPAGERAPRLRRIVRKMVADLFDTIDRFDVSEDEFWSALNFMAQAAPEFGLIAAGLGVEHFIDLRLDARDRDAGVPQGTPRTIEGPLYVAGAPLVASGARIDDGRDEGEALVMQGQVLDTDGRPVAGAIVDVWHANTRGNYSIFDKTQTDYNMRRRIRADADGRYAFSSIIPAGYGVPPGGATDRLLALLGRHGNRPAHIHFFVTAPGHRQLTTQVNIDGDPYLHDDFAYATRDALIATVERETTAEGGHAVIVFDFVLSRASDPRDEALSGRPRLAAIA